MTLQQRVDALTDRWNFLCDAYVAGMADGPEVERAHELMEQAKAELATLTTTPEPNNGR